MLVINSIPYRVTRLGAASALLMLFASCGAQNSVATLQPEASQSFGPFRVSSQVGRLTNAGWSWDCGTIQAGTPIRCEVELLNISPAIVQISDVAKSCGCTRAHITNQVLAIGERATVKIEIDTSGRVGVFSAAVYVKGGPDGTLLLPLALSALIEKQTVLVGVPDRVEFGIVTANMMPTARVELRSRIQLGSDGLKLSEVLPGANGSVAIVIEAPRTVVSDGGQWVDLLAYVDITLPKEKPIGIFEDRITVRASDGVRDYASTIAVAAEVTDCFVLKHNAVFMDRVAVASTQDKRLSVQLQEPCGPSFEAHSESDWCRVKVGAHPADARDQWVDVSVLPLTKGIQSSFIVLTAGSTVRRVPITVYAE